MDVITVLECIGLAILIVVVYKMYHKGGGDIWEQ